MRYFRLNTVPSFLLLTLLAACSFKSASDGKKADAMFTADQLQQVGGQITRANSQNVEKTFDLRVCLRDAATSRLIPDETFEVHGGPETLALTTNPEGCLMWTETLSFNPVASQVYVTLQRELRPTGAYRESAPISLSVGVSPWRDQAGVADLRYQKVSPLLPPESTADALAGKIPAGANGAPADDCAPRLTLPGYSFTFDGASYAIDRYLSLSIRRGYVLFLKPQVYTCRSLDHGPSSELVREGTRFHLQVAFVSGVTAEGKPAQFLSGFQSEVTADEKGQIATHLALANAFTDEILVRNRVSLLVELAPAGGDRLQPVAGQAVLSGLGSSAAGSGDFAVLPVGAAAQDRPATQSEAWNGGVLLTPAPTLTVTPEKMLAEATRKKPEARWVELDESDLARKSERDFLARRGFRDEAATRAFLARLCTAAPDDTQRARCESDPAVYFDLNAMEVVEGIESEPRLLPAQGPSPVLQVNAAFFNALTHSDRQTDQGSRTEHGREQGTEHVGATGSRGGITAHRGYNIEATSGLVYFGSGASLQDYGGNETFGGTQWYQEHQAHQGTVWRTTTFEAAEILHAEDQMERLSFSRAGILRTEELDFSFLATVHVCALVSARVGILRGKFPETVYCALLPHQTETESWYFLADVTGSTDVVAREQVWSRVVRGKKAFEGFARALEDHTRNFVMRNRTRQAGEQVSLAFAASMATQSGAYPGVLAFQSRPHPFRWTEDQITKLTALCVSAAPANIPRETAQAYCRCSYESLAEHCTYAEYEGDPDKWDKILRDDLSEAACRS